LLGRHRLPGDPRWRRLSARHVRRPRVPARRQQRGLGCALGQDAGWVPIAASSPSESGRPGGRSNTA
jgi:hypothetical protein